MNSETENKQLHLDGAERSVMCNVRARLRQEEHMRLMKGEARSKWRGKAEDGRTPNQAECRPSMVVGQLLHSLYEIR